MRLIDADGFLDRNAEFANREFIHPKYQATLRELIDSEPTISPDEVRGVGEWEHQELAPTNWTFCSVCGRQRSKKYKWYYCPNCGAKMKGATDGTTE